MDLESDLQQLDTVRALHQTVVSLRAALERSRSEVRELQGLIWPSGPCEAALHALSIENHILRRRIVDCEENTRLETQLSPKKQVRFQAIEQEEQNIKETSEVETKDKACETDVRNSEESKQEEEDKSSVSLSSDPVKDVPQTNKPVEDIKKIPDRNKKDFYDIPKDIQKEVEQSQKALEKAQETLARIRRIPQNINEQLGGGDTSNDNSLDISESLKTPCTYDNNKNVSPENTLFFRKEEKLLKVTEIFDKRVHISKEITKKTVVRSKNNCSQPSHQGDTYVSDDSDSNQVKSENVSSEEQEVTDMDPDDLKLKDLSVRDEVKAEKEVEQETEEVDDIELIFTTDETKISTMKDELVSIEGTETDHSNTPILLHYKTFDSDSAVRPDKDSDDDVFHESETGFESENLNFPGKAVQMFNSKSDNSINHDSFEENSNKEKSLKSCYSYQDSSFESRSLEKDESFDRFEERDQHLHNMWSENSILIETDISKCGIVDSEMYLAKMRRNTCPNPLSYKPMIHREALSKQTALKAPLVKFSRPILNENRSPKRENEAQTDISALPSLWKSESYLAHKVAHQFTTLPSKYPINVSQKCLRLSEKTKEARRVLLSDINFTSMVPELSRSADHLCQEGVEIQQPQYGQYLRTADAYLRRYNTGDSLTSPNFMQSQKFTWSPSDCSTYGSTKFDNSSLYLNRYRGSLTSMNSPSNYDFPDVVKRRSYSSSYWKHNVPGSFDNYRSRQASYSSVPTSPTRQRRSRSVPFVSTYSPSYQRLGLGRSSDIKRTHSKVTFQQNSFEKYKNCSLPDLHTGDSGDSTDSLVDEAEQYVRRSIDCMITGGDSARAWISKPRRLSAPNPVRETSPPPNWQPFLPRCAKDLRLENWVKVINQDGRIRGGRVRYVGLVAGQHEPFVGIQMSCSDGNSDGTFNGRRYFDCESNHAIFVPFKKVVMGWRT